MLYTWINSTATDPQFGIFNINSKYFFFNTYWEMEHAYCFLRSILHLRQTIFLLWNFRNYSCTFFQKSQIYGSSELTHVFQFRILFFLFYFYIYIYIFYFYFILFQFFFLLILFLLFPFFNFSESFFFLRSIFFHFISFRFPKWNKMKTTWPRTDIAPKINYNGRLLTHACAAAVC